jgi:hypothetical protein
MRPGDLQAQVPWTNAFWFADAEARKRLTRGSLSNKSRSVLRPRRTGRTRIIAESQGNGGFSLADSQSTKRRERYRVNLARTGRRGRCQHSLRTSEMSLGRWAVESPLLRHTYSVQGIQLKQNRTQLGCGSWPAK